MVCAEDNSSIIITENVGRRRGNTASALSIVQCLFSTTPDNIHDTEPV